jgi:hypothetical protein
LAASKIFCRCSSRQAAQAFAVRSFCGTCTFLIPLHTIERHSSFPSCGKYESWQNGDTPCLSCQLASIVHRNPFGKRLSTLQNIWLPITQDSDNSSASDDPKNFPSPSLNTFASPVGQIDLKKTRQATKGPFTHIFNFKDDTLLLLFFCLGFFYHIIVVVTFIEILLFVSIVINYDPSSSLPSSIHEESSSARTKLIDVCYELFLK